MENVRCVALKPYFLKTIRLGIYALTESRLNKSIFTGKNRAFKWKEVSFISMKFVTFKQ